MPQEPNCGHSCLRERAAVRGVGNPGDGGAAEDRAARIGGAGYDKVAPKVEGTLPFSNSEFLVDSSGKITEQYNKIRL